MRKLKGVLAAVVIGATLAGCSDALNVQNPNNPDQDRALARPTDVEALISGSYNTIHRNTIGTTNLTAPLGALGMENYSNLANFGMGTRSAIPRPPIDNSRNNATAGENYGPFLGLHRGARAAALGLSRVNRPDFTFFPPSATQNARARAFAHFVIGVALGQVAMAYDSGSAINENDDLTSNTPLALIAHDTLATYALSKLDSARAIALTMGATTLPAIWLSASGTDLSVAQFRGLIAGWKARIRASVARDETEAAAVDWAAVRADADSFLLQFPTGYTINLNPSLGWTAAWVPQMFQSESVNWHQMWGFYAGMAGDQAQFEAWLGTASASRTPYLVITDDLRWPIGATEAAQEADLGGGRPAGVTKYWENRAAGIDWFGEGTGNSRYRSSRFLALRNASTIGPYPLITAAEMRLLAAEADYMLGQYAAAAARVNVTRVLNGLPAAPADNTTLVGNGTNGCVPRIPTGGSATACGNLLEALKWEFRMETAHTGWGHWYFAGRRWGDLPAGTPLEYPVPYQEMDTRRQAFFSSVGPSAPGNYGI
jgi:hypothetical protein